MAKKLSAYNRHMSREMKKGKTFKQAVASWRSKKRGSPRKTTRRTTRRSLPKSRTRRNPVSRKRGFLSTQTFMKFARLFALAAPAAAVAMGPGSPADKVKEGARKYTGFDMNSGSFNFASLAEGWLPFVATAAVTHGISKLIGIIRRV